jgi:membrane-bound lytic murein transglycosylase B
MKRGMKRSIPLLIILAFFNSMAHSQESNEIPSGYLPLFSRLSREGFDPQLLSFLLSDPRAELNLSMLTLYLNLNSREVSEVYSQFLTPEQILLSKKFLQENMRTLRKMERNFQVDKEVVVAILLVESKFGENIGKHRVIPTLASMALMDSPESLEENYRTLKENNPELTYEWLEGFAKRKASWAYEELKCFLRIIQHEKIDPLEVYGSYAGALGMPQFVPSSYVAYAMSEKSFESWLFNKEEAILSIGNYLKSHGWKKKMTTDKKRKILWYYNRSEPYVEIILKIAQRLRQK